MKVKLLVILFLALIMVSCSIHRKITTDEIRAIITKKTQTIRTTLKNGDPSFVVNSHTDDAIQFLPDGTEIVGKEALKAFYSKVAASRVDIESVTTTVEKLSKDMAMEVGIFTSTTTAGKQSKGKYILIWKNVDNDWKIYKAIDQAKL